MVYSKKYSLSVEKRVYIYPLISSMSIKIDDKSGFLHVINEFVARNIYNRAGCTASCGERSHSIRCRLTQISISYSVEQSVAHLFTFCRVNSRFYSLLVAHLFTSGRRKWHFYSLLVADIFYNTLLLRMLQVPLRSI